MVRKELPVGLRNVPIAIFAGAVVVAHILVGQNLGEAARTIMLACAPFARRAAAGSELAFGQFMFDQPEAQLALPIAVGNCNIRISAYASLITQRPFIPGVFIAKIATPELQAIAIIQVIGCERRNVRVDRLQDRSRMRVSQDGQEQIDRSGLGTGHVIEVNVHAELVVTPVALQLLSRRGIEVRPLLSFPK